MATKDRTALKDEFKNGNLATGERFTDLIDSMKVVQEPVADPAASGTSLSFIDSISQDADGKITPTKKTLDLSNAHELNPFKGWWKTGDTLPTSGFDGAYLYFKDTDQTPAVTTIFRWNGTGYADTGVEVDESNVQTFETGQALNVVAIDGTGLENPLPNALAKAGDVMPLAVKLEGATASEEKVVNYPVANGFIACRDYSTTRVAAHYYTDNSRKTAFIALDDSKSVRFLGLKVRNIDYIVGYAYLNIEDNITDFISSLENNDDLTPYIVGGVKPFDVDSSLSSENPTKLEKITSSNPIGANYIALFYDSNSSSSYDVKDTNFYCYLQSGESVGSLINNIIKNITFSEKERVVGYTQYDSRQIDTNGYWVEGAGKSAIVEVNPGDVIVLNEGEPGYSYAILTEIPTTVNKRVSFASGYNGRFFRSQLSDTNYTIVVPSNGHYLYKQIYSSSTGYTTSTEDKIIASNLKEHLDKVTEFSSGESVSEIGIDDTALSNPEQNSIPKAIDVKNILGGIDYNSVGAEFSTWHPANENNGYYLLNRSWYSPTSTISSSIVDITGYEYVRFLGITFTSTPNKPACYAFLDESYNVLYIEQYLTTGNSGEYEYFKEIVPNAKYFVFLTTHPSITNTPYCYLQIGKNVKQLIDSKEGNQEYIGITHIRPDNEGQLNAVRKMRKLTDLNWVPSFELPRLSATLLTAPAKYFNDPFTAYKEYKGIPYGRGRKNYDEYGYNVEGIDGFKIGLSISLETFVTAINNKGTVVEKESEYQLSNHNACFYANVCSGSVCAALGISFINSSTFANTTPPSGFSSVGIVEEGFNLYLLKLGDVMSISGHTVMITDIIKKNGVITHVEVSESTVSGNDNYNVAGTSQQGSVFGGVARRLWWSSEQFFEKWQDYKVIRYGAIENISYTPSPYVPMPDEYYGYAPYLMSILPYMGNGFRFVAGSMPDAMRKLVVEVKDQTKIHILKDGADYGELLDIPAFNTGSGEGEGYEYVYVNLPSDMPVGDYEAYACNLENEQEINKTRKCKWSVVDTLTRLQDY